MSNLIDDTSHAINFFNFKFPSKDAIFQMEESLRMEVITALVSKFGEKFCGLVE